MSKYELEADPRGLIFEAYQMDIGPAECRSIFLDWAVGLKTGAGLAEVAALLERYGAAYPDHPMTAVLREGVERSPAPRRGRRARSETSGN